MKNILSLFAITILTFLLLTFTSNARAVTIDFEALDVSSGWVTGSLLDDYLAGFGVTLTNLTPGTDPGPYSWIGAGPHGPPVLPGSTNVLGVTVFGHTTTLIQDMLIVGALGALLMSVAVYAFSRQE